MQKLLLCLFTLVLGFSGFCLFFFFPSRLLTLLLLLSRFSGKENELMVFFDSRQLSRSPRTLYKHGNEKVFQEGLTAEASKISCELSWEGGT